MKIKYSEAKELINEGDVLLFRHNGFPGIGWLIGMYSQSPYSHVGLAHWDGDDLYCLEMREFKGAREYPMDKYVKEYPNRIDVFRVCQCICIPEIVNTILSHKIIEYIYKPFDEDVVDKIIKQAHQLADTHKNYSYWLIFKIMKTFIPFMRLWHRPKYKDNNGQIYVCSTMVTKTYRTHYHDPVPFLSDEYTKPGDIARSAIFNQLFTII